MYPQVHLLQYLNPSINDSCEQLFKGDKQERQQIRNVLKSCKPLNDTETIELIKDCQHIRTEFMDSFYISETERNFPLAFQMLIYYQQNLLLQHIRLLKYLYRPHNIYCIHIDKILQIFNIRSSFKLFKKLVNVTVQQIGDML